MKPSDPSLANWILLLDGTAIGASEPQAGDATSHYRLSFGPDAPTDSISFGVRPVDAQSLSASVGREVTLLDHARREVGRAQIEKVDAELGLVNARAAAAIMRTMH